MRLRLPTDNPILDALLSIAYLILFLGSVRVAVYLSVADATWAIKAAILVGDVCGVVAVALVFFEHILKLLERVRRQWQRTFHP